MRIIKRSTLLMYARKEPSSLSALKHWYSTVGAATWQSFSELRRTFTTADLVRTRLRNTVVVFDIGGNKHRLIAHVSYGKGKVYVLRILTHREYDRDRWKDEV